jgi:predicted negative regulator of RcsB-dependent stress response
MRGLKVAEIIGKDGNRVEQVTFFERLFLLEGLLKKYKKGIAVVVTVAIVAVLGYVGNGIYEDSVTERLNLAYYDYKRGENSEDNLKYIEANSPKLYSLILFSEAISSGSADKLKMFVSSKDQVLSDIATYQLASIEKSSSDLNNYSYAEKAIYKDLAILSEAYLLIRDGDVEKAKNRLSFIEEGSQVKEIANYLSHYGLVTK